MDIEDAIADSRVAVRRAATLRKDLRWNSKRWDSARRERIELEIRRLGAAMAPIRSAIGRLVWEPVAAALDTRLRDASRALQYERKQLKKMLP